MEFVFALSLIFGTAGLALGILNTLRGWHHQSVINRNASLDIRNFERVAEFIEATQGIVKTLFDKLDNHERNIRHVILTGNHNDEIVKESLQTLIDGVELAHQRISRKASDLFPRVTSLEFARRLDAERITELKRRLDEYRDAFNENADQDDAQAKVLEAVLNRHDELHGMQSLVNRACSARLDTYDGAFERLFGDVKSLTLDVEDAVDGGIDRTDILLKELQERTGSLRISTASKDELLYLQRDVNALRARLDGIQGSGLRLAPSPYLGVGGVGIAGYPGAGGLQQADGVFIGGGGGVASGAAGAGGTGGVVLTKKHCRTSTEYWENCPDCRELNELGSGDNQTVQS